MSLFIFSRASILSASWDVFTFWVDNTGNLRPMGSPDSIWPAKKSCDRKKSLNSAGPIQGIGCMYNVINNVDY